MSYFPLVLKNRYMEKTSKLKRLKRVLSVPCRSTWAWGHEVWWKWEPGCGAHTIWHNSGISSSSGSDATPAGLYSAPRPIRCPRELELRCLRFEAMSTSVTRMLGLIIHVDLWLQKYCNQDLKLGRGHRVRGAFLIQSLANRLIYSALHFFRALFTPESGTLR